MNNRQITEENLARADSFRVQVQLKKREYKILHGGVYNWMARDCPESAGTVRDALDDIIINILKQELRRIVHYNPSAVKGLYAFLEQNIPDRRLLAEAHNMIAEIIKQNSN